MAISMKAMRVNANLSQEEAAKKIGVSKDVIYNWETGRSTPDVLQAYKMADAYHCAIDDIDFLRSCVTENS